MERNIIQNLILRMQQQGISLWTEDGKLKFRDLRRSMTPSIKHELTQHKAEIIEYLKVEEKRIKVPLTSIQYAYLLGCAKGYELGNSNAHYYLEYEIQSLDVTRLEKALNQMIQQFDALRMVIMPSGYQYALGEAPLYSIKEVKLSSEEELLMVREKRKRYFYPLGQWPMFHFEVSHLAHRDILHIDFDCIILDATSARLMIKKLFQIYQGNEVIVPKYDFSTYMLSKSQEEHQNSHNLEAAEGYWQQQIQTMPKAPMLDYKKSFAEVEKPEFSRVEHYFTEEETNILYEVAKKHCVTPAVVICTAFMKVLSKGSQEKALTLNLTLFNREMYHPDVLEVLGDFTNIGFASYHGTDGLDFLSEVQAVQKQFWKLLQYRSYDGTKVLKTLSKGEIGKAIMPVVFTCVLGGMDTEMAKMPFKEIYSLSQTPQVCLDHHVRDDQGVLKISWDYIEELFENFYIHSMFEKYVEILKIVMSNVNWKQLFC